MGSERDLINYASWGKKARVELPRQWIDSEEEEEEDTKNNAE